MKRFVLAISLLAIIFFAILLMLTKTATTKFDKPNRQWDGFTSVPANVLNNTRPLIVDRNFEVDCAPDFHALPPEYRTGERAVSFTLLDSSDREYWKQVVQTELKKYDPIGCGSVLSKVYVVNNLWIGKTNVVGTFGNDCIFVAVRVGDSSINDYFIRSAIHHELAGIICNNYGGPDFDKWCQLNQKDYMGEDPLKVVIDSNKKIDLIGSDSRLFQYGFLTKYSSTNAFKDMCTYHEKLMMCPDWLKTVGALHPNVEKKLVLWTTFLRKLPVGVPAGF